ncbi:RagB/SusD family nutrient uptake outer membrane protein [Sphingobacterium pedocola]|uniref:RagB/SusD family nutrient uptake outer membrane protein n=1 Tax=Sphingobacterium pedocola TaxID=2082722 RepID=A0ABR9TAS5_9SPHI|nr:RagB/SusD family nutrient uptake outer membrane protein [Sphingobacterium pedocola]MBE8722406.1 RagB/SusD family nutrient uptake outer membrane protein [Sphingobacterium pedocola]
MNTRKIKHIALLSAFLGTTTFSFQSCTDLHEQVYSEALGSSINPTEKDLPFILAPAYASFRSLMFGWQGYFDLQEESADHIITPVRPNGWDDAGTYRRMHQHTWTSEEWQPYNTWQQAYASITKANMVIMQIEDGTLNLPEEVGQAALAELRTARALAYYLLLDNHGNVPIVTDYRDDSLPDQKTRKELYDFVVKELTEVLPNLSEEVGTSMYGRLNRWGAKALLAKIYLNAEVYTGTAQWQKVIDEADDIIKTNNYRLDDNYRSVFSSTNQNSSEIIFAVPYDEIYGHGNQLHMKSLDPLSRLVYAMAAGPWGGNCAVPQFIDTYDTDDSRLHDSWLQGPQYHASTGVEVINYLKHVPGIGGDGTIAASNAGYRLGKYEIKKGATTNLDNDYPMFRYADILMMKAEALLRTARADEAAVLVTQVRRRAFLDNPEKAIVTGGDLQKGSTYNYGWQEKDGSVATSNGGADIQYGRFLDELGWEFAAEARRRQDIIRFGVFQTKSWFNHRPHAKAQSRTLFPIPNAERTKNPKLDQNDDY